MIVIGVYLSDVKLKFDEKVRTGTQTLSGIDPFDG